MSRNASIWVIWSQSGGWRWQCGWTSFWLQRPLKPLIKGQWQEINLQRKNSGIPPPHGRAGVYWFDMPETFTLPQTQFFRSNGNTKSSAWFQISQPSIGEAAHWFPADWCTRHNWVFSFTLVISSRPMLPTFSGIMAIRSEVAGRKDACSASWLFNFGAWAGQDRLWLQAPAALPSCCYENSKPGKSSLVEQALLTNLFEQVYAKCRGIKIHQTYSNYKISISSEGTATPGNVGCLQSNKLR